MAWSTSCLTPIFMMPPNKSGGMLPMVTHSSGSKGPQSWGRAGRLRPSILGRNTMEYRKLGDTDLDVSLICLGTMTWGQQNSLDDALQQLDYALAQGVNFIDAAEMYPVPPRAE